METPESAQVSQNPLGPEEGEDEAAELFDAFTSEVLAGNEVSLDAYLERCPESQRERLRDAAHGLAFYAAYRDGTRRVRPEILAKMMHGLETIRRERLTGKEQQDGTGN